MRSVFTGPKVGKSANSDPRIMLMRSAATKTGARFTLLGKMNTNRRPVSLAKVTALDESKDRRS